MNPSLLNISNALELGILLLFFLVWAAVVITLRVRRKVSVIFLVFFSLFYFYLYKVLDYTLFQFQSLLLLKYFVPDLMLNGQGPGKALNLIPLVTLGSEDLKTSLLNVLMMIPFGFGLPFAVTISVCHGNNPRRITQPADRTLAVDLWFACGSHFPHCRHQ